MFSQLSKKAFARAVKKHAEVRLAALGFDWEEPTVFLERAGQITKSVGFIQGKVRDSFCVSVGPFVNAIEPMFWYIGGCKYISVAISQRLGDFRNNMRGSETWYSAGTEPELLESLDAAMKDFEEQAIPWLNKFETVADIAAEYYLRQIATPKGMSRRPPNPFAWADYAWMLDECGRHDEAKTWKERAVKYLEDREIIGEGAGFVMTAGPANAPRTEAESRLLALLKNPELARGGHA